MASLLNCSACNRALRVPEELLGRNVKCPSCGHVFTAPLPGGAARPVAPPISEPQEPEYEQDPYRERYQEYEPRRRSSRKRERAAGRLRPPAIALLIVGILALLFDLFNVGFALVADEPDIDKNDPPFLQEMQKGAHGPVAAVMQGGFAFLAVLIILGSIMMLRTQMWGLALTASIAAMLHLGTCCCLFGIPFGIWALVVLCSEDVKSAFT